MTGPRDYKSNQYYENIADWDNWKATIDTATLMKQSSDAFNKLIADSTTNTLDLPSTYPFSPERYKLVLNGTRYRDISGVSQITDIEGSFLLQPEMGDNLRIQSAERPRYVVQYESVASIALNLQDALESGDRIEAGLNDFQSLENAAYFEFNGDGNHRAVIIGQGNEVITQSFELPDNAKLTDALRLEIKFNWYNVGRYLFSISYTDSSKIDGEKQENKILAELTLDDDFATGDPNMHLYAEFDSMYSGKTLEVGSFGYIVLGDVIPTARTKSARLTGMSYGGSGQYEALAAIRIDPDFGNIFTQMNNVTVVPQNEEGQLLALSVDSEDTDASGWSKPPEHSENNSIVEFTTDVSTFPNESGNVVSQASNPGGYQLGFSSSDLAGRNRKTRVTDPGTQEKRPIYEDDVVVLVYKGDSATSDTINFTYSITQEW